MVVGVTAEQLSLSAFGAEADRPDLEDLTEAEKDAVMAVDLGPYGVREYARETGRSPGTVSNLLTRARRKVPALDSRA